MDIVDPTTQSITDFVSARTVTVNTTTIVNGVTTTTSRLDTVVSVDLDGKDTQFGRSDVTYLENVSISLNDLINGGHVIV